MCLAAFYAFLDTEHVNLAEAGVTAEVARKFSPLAQLLADASGMPPLFIARAGKDAIPGVNASIDKFVAAALERNTAIALANHPDGSHGFDHRDDDARTREILRMSIAVLSGLDRRLRSLGDLRPAGAPAVGSPKGARPTA